MTKSELIKRLNAIHPHLFLQDCERIVDTIFQTMTDALKDGNRIELRGFGAFFVKARPPRKGRNPRTGESVSVPGKKAPHFRTGKQLHDDLNS